MRHIGILRFSERHSRRVFLPFFLTFSMSCLRPCEATFHAQMVDKNSLI